MAIPDGFPGQRMLVLPESAIARALSRAGTRQLLVTDVGYFPEAHHHGRKRATGIEECVVLLCTDGSGWCETQTGIVNVERGQVVILPPHHPHAYGANGSSPWTLWWLHLRGHDMGEFLKSASMGVETPVRTVSDPYRAVALIEEILGWMERDTTDSSQLAASGAAWHLMALLAADRPTAHPRSAAVDKAAEHIRVHVDQPLDIDRLATASAMSRSHFTSLFKKQFGLPVLQFQTQLRMSRARELLDTTTTPVAQVASRTGYDNAYYFSRQFKKVHGMSPREYRARGDS